MSAISSHRYAVYHALQVTPLRGLVLWLDWIM
jgi:hypothetical protein